MKIIIITILIFTTRVHCMESNHVDNYKEIAECPSNWFDAGENGCFYFAVENRGTSWITAMKVCEDLGGILAEPKTNVQMSILSGWALAEESLTGINRWWLGGSDTGREGYWEWMGSLTSVDTTFWSASSPNTEDGNTDDCIALVRESVGTLRWKDIDCSTDSHTIAPICQLSNCPQGWTQYEESCYKFFGESMKWLDAETTCQNLGGHLASIHSKQEHDLCTSLQTGDSVQYIWFGGNPLQDDVFRWFWSDGSKWDFDYWHSGEPHGSTETGNLACRDYAWQWRNIYTYEAHPFVCKLKM